MLSPILRLGSLRSFFMLVSAALLTGEVLADDGRGQRVFHLCASCHGEKGEGRQELGAPAIAGMPQWYLEAQLVKFRTGVRGLHPRDLGGMRMRPLARTIKDTDVAAVAEYVAKLPATEAPVTVRGDIVKGEEQYRVCQSCHGADGKGSQELNAPPLVNQSDWYLLTQLKHFKNGVRAGDPAKDPTGAAMAPMAQILDEQGMRNVIAYIHALK